jgi:hypothetical protein
MISIEDLNITFGIWVEYNNKRSSWKEIHFRQFFVTTFKPDQKNYGFSVPEHFLGSLYHDAPTCTTYYEVSMLCIFVQGMLTL